MAKLGQILMQAAPAAIETVTGIGRGKKNREHALKMQQLQFANQKALNQQGFDLSKRMWDETNYNAQMKELKKAGLNPALMYGQAGAGGTTQAGSGGSASAGAPATDTTGQGVGMLLQQAQLLKAQKENIQADTKVKEAEATKTSGVDTEEAKNRINQIKQDIQNKEAQQYLTNSQKTLADIQIYEANRSQEDRMNYIQWGAERAYQEFIKATNEAYISVNTKDEIITQIQQETIGAVLKNMLAEKQIKATEAQIEKMSADIAQGWKELDIKDESNAIQEFKNTVDANYPTVMEVIGRGVDDTVDMLFNLGNRQRKQYKGRRDN